MKRLVFPAMLLLITHCGRDDKQKDQGEEAKLPDPAPVVAGDETPASLSVSGGVGTKAPISVNFQPKVAGEELVCFDGSDALLQKGQVFTDARIFISNLLLVDAQGKEHQVALNVAPNSSNLQFVDGEKNHIALLNFLDPSCASSDATKTVKTAITGSLPSGDYKAVRFSIGLPYVASDEKLTQLPASLMPSDMAWMWSHHPADLQLEMNTGSSQGSSKKILNKLISVNKVAITVPVTHQQAAGSDNSVAINVDFSKLFKTSAAAFVMGLEADCNNKSGPLKEEAAHCAFAYRALGLPVADETTSSEQTVFSGGK